MTKQDEWFVFLTPAYLEEIKQGVLYEECVDHLMGYIHCSKLETDEPYLCITIISESYNVQAQIPHSAVSYILLSLPEKHPGFGSVEQVPDKKSGEHPEQSTV